jgi:hypothetical protein
MLIKLEYPIKSLLRMLKFEARFHILAFVGCKKNCSKGFKPQKNIVRSNLFDNIHKAHHL